MRRREKRVEIDDPAVVPVDLRRVTRTIRKQLVTSATTVSAPITADAFASSQRVIRKSMFITVTKRHISNRSCISGMNTRNTIITVISRRVSNTKIPRVIIRSAILTLNTLTGRGVRHQHTLRAPFAIVNVANSIKGAAAGSLVGTLLTRVKPAVTPIKSFGGRVKLPLSSLGMRTRAHFLITRVNTGRIKRVTGLASLIPPSVTIILGINITRLKRFNSPRHVTRTGSRVVHNLIPNNLSMLGTGSRRITTVDTVTPNSIV